jgi:hypothetical protein
MSATNGISRRGRCVVLALTCATAALLALAACGGSSSTSGSASAVGVPPPEWAANAGSWPAHNYDLSNTRATTQTSISAETVSQLKAK